MKQAIQFDFESEQELKKMELCKINLEILCKVLLEDKSGYDFG